jgi:hypothetical protein
MVQPALASYGAGRLFGQGTSPSAAPLEFGVLQSVDLDFSFTTKPLFGQNQFAVFVARGEAKWGLKAKVGVMSGLLMNSIFFGLTLASGGTQLQPAEAHVVPVTPFQVTIAPPSSGTFVADEGVVNAATLLPLTLVASGPITGQYSVNPATGIYTFATADVGTNLLISYTYSVASAGQSIAITNQLLGTTPYFSGVFRNRDPRSGLFNTLVLNRMTSSKLTLHSKTNDFSIPEFDAEIMDDGTGNIGTMSFGDRS